MLSACWHSTDIYADINYSESQLPRNSFVIAAKLWPCLRYRGWSETEEEDSVNMPSPHMPNTERDDLLSLGKVIGRAWISVRDLSLMLLAGAVQLCSSASTFTVALQFLSTRYTLAMTGQTSIWVKVVWSSAALKWELLANDSVLMCETCKKALSWKLPTIRIRPGTFFNGI